MRVLITGATSGIGYSLASTLSERGHTVYATTHTEKQAEILRKKVEDESKKILCFKMDITKEKDRELVKNIEIDVLVNHAGIGYGGSILEMDIDTLRENYETNIFSSFQLLQDFYKIKCKKRKPAKIFITSSIISMLPLPYLGCYSSSKAAISMLAFTLKEELKSLNKNISVSLIEPGAYRTGFNQVMIDNKTIFSEKEGYVFDNCKNINRIQRSFFTLIEKDNHQKLVNKVVKEIESEHPKFKIRSPFSQLLFAKLYLLFYR